MFLDPHRCKDAKQTCSDKKTAGHSAAYFKLS